MCVCLQEKEESDEEEDKDDTSGPDFNYILSLPLWCLTKEKKEEYIRQRDGKVGSVKNIKPF